MNVSTDFDSIVVGAGFSGLYMLHRLLGMGHRALVVEKGSGVGGTWYWNRYPGARCDIASLEYSYQFDAALQQEWNWSEKYSAQPEILRYANHVADRFNLRPHIKLEAAVVAAEYDEAANLWNVTTEDRAGIQATTSTRFLIAASGCLSSPNKPEIEGLCQFDGPIYYTSEWPHEPIDFSGQRVGVIGTGSSGIQAIPVIAERAAHLTVFQRTANYAVPARNAAMDAEHQEYVKSNYAQLREQAASTRNGHLTQPYPHSAMAVGEADREKQYAARWRQGGLAVIGSFNDLTVSQASNQTAAEFVKAKIRELVDDPETAKRLSPTTKIGCKRLCVDSGYYETFNRTNVSLIDINETPISSIESNGIFAGEQFVPLDVLIFATGFDAMTGSLLKMNLSGRNAVKLADQWHAGPTTYLGIAVHNFPNFFTITGPGSPSVLTNMLPTIEQHVNLLSTILKHAQTQNVNRIEAQRDAQQAWVEHVNATAAKTIYPSCNSWYLGANVAGKPRVFMPYIGFPDYVKRCEDMVAKGFQGFEFAE